MVMGHTLSYLVRTGAVLAYIFGAITTIRLFVPDSLFSLIIFIYVSITFLYMFYAFCWREQPRKRSDDEEKQVRIFIFTSSLYYHLFRLFQ
jgi:hypothetical protein